MMRTSEKLLAVGLSLAFVVLSLAAKLLPWWALSSLGEHSLLRATATGLIALLLVVGLTVLGQRLWPGLASPDLVLFPRAHRQALLRPAVALLAGAGLFVIVYAVARLTGGIGPVWSGPTGTALAFDLLTGLIATVLNAAWEEYTFRGWPFSCLVHALGSHLVALAMGTVFGLAHLFNPQWTWPAILSTALAGYLICYTMLAYRHLLVPIALHVGWNYCQSLLTSRSYWHRNPHPSALLSGGRYGLEASLAGIVVTALAAVTMCVVSCRAQRGQR